MSAAIVQKNNTTSLYFECGDIFDSDTISDKHHHIRINRSTISELNSLTLESSNKMIQETTENLSDGGDCTRIHGQLSRTISYPQSHTQQQDSSNVTTLVTSLIENLGNMNLHRKLERTQSEPLPQQVNTSRYKTELCRPFEEAGECKYGEKCQFAHGYHELRNLQRHPKYKTEYCRTFHSVGFCPYGPRCHFVHNADEARAMQQQLQQQQQQQQIPTKLQNHSTTYNNSNANNMSTYTLSPTPKQLAGGAQLINHSLPLSPPLSMSTGSDRESPTGSLSLSPTSSMTNFPFAEQVSPVNSVFQSSFSYVNSTPPESPNAPISPISTPPPSTMVLNQQQQSTAAQSVVYIKPISKAIQIATKQVLQKSCSSPTNVIANSNSNVSASTNNMDTSTVSSVNGEIEARLPVFNRFSSTTEFFPSNVAT